MSYDQKCYDLAEAFLEDEPELNTEKNRDELAQAIQDVIEGHLSFHFRQKDAPASDGVSEKAPHVSDASTSHPDHSAGRADG